MNIQTQYMYASTAQRSPKLVSPAASTNPSTSTTAPPAQWATTSPLTICVLYVQAASPIVSSAHRVPIALSVPIAVV